MKARARLFASTAAPRVQARAAAMPHKALMVTRYGKRAAHVPVIVGPAVAASLKRRQSDAAALDGVIFLPHCDVSSDLVAHELVHALQQGGARHSSPETMLTNLDAAPALPARSAAESEAQHAHDIAPGDAPNQSLPAGVAALRRTGEVPELDRAPAPAEAEPEVPPAELSQAEAEPTPAPGGGEAESSEIAPTFELPPMPETALDPEAQARRDAEKQAAEEALAAADSPSAVMDAYASMAPSVKAQNMAGLGTRLGDANAQSTSDMVVSTPPVEVHVSGSESEMPTPPPIALPAEAGAQDLAAPDAPTIDVPEGPEQPVIATDPGYGSFIERLFSAGADAERIDENIDAVSVSNPGIESRVTDRADVPLEGANDPALMDQDATARRGEASAARGEAAQAVVTGPGPEQVVPRAMDQSVPLPEQPPRETSQITPAPEAEQLQALALPEEVVAGFDSATGAQMEASAAATRDEMSAAETKRDDDHQAAVAQADMERQAAETKADEDQRAAVGERRTAIQGERQRTVDAQAAAVDDVNAEAEAARQQGRTDAETQVAQDRETITSEYDRAERDSDAEVARGEQEAEAERERKRRESEDMSWWERAASFIADAFQALTRLVNAIFDAVRSAVTAIIDAARRAVVALIEAAARALQALISAFGALLKGLINNLLGAIFPELAAALTAFIDDAVAFANAAIDAVANVLIDAVNAIAAALTSAMNALLDLYQSAINAALNLAQAVLTGDWSALLRQVLETVLSLLGIDPQAFYALIAQASDAIEIIVNDPLHFVGNLVSAFVGGVQLFADNFLGHLRRGIIGWLTGALGDITLPDEWNIWGVLDLARQVMGLTWDFLRERAARVIGAENVARLEFIGSWVGTLITEGWSGLWTRIQGELDSLKDTVLDAIKSLILERVVMASITWLASLFNPVGAIVKLVMTIWNLYQFVSNQLQRLMGIAQAVVGMISNIAHDVLDPAKQRVEEVLGNLVPVVIDLLMSLLGVSGVATRVREIIQNVRQSIADAADRLIQRVLSGFRGGSGTAAGTPDAAGGAAGAAGQIGHPVRIDVAEGEDHTLSVDRTGAGGATVMLRSEPRPLSDWLTTLAGMASRETDATKKADAERDIATARGILTRLDPAADRAAGSATGTTTPAPTADVVRMEEDLGPVLTRVFNALQGATSAFADQFRSDLEHAHPQAQVMIRQELRTHAGEWAALSNWEAVSAALKRTSQLFLDPLDSSRTFGGLARDALSAAIPAEHRALEARILTLVRQKVRDGASDAEYVALRTKLHESILTNAALTGGTALADAATKAATELSASTDVDPALRAAVGSDLESFLLAMAKGQTVGGVSPADFDRLWDSPGGANKEFIASRFRVPTGRHEWIPTNYIPNVLAAARSASEEEGMEVAALWVRVHDVWRSDTELLIYKPETGWRRNISVTVPGRSGPQAVTVPQGHVGSVYAKADDSGLALSPQQQTIGQGPWHDELRAIFDSNTAVPSESRAALTRVIEQIEAYSNRTLWRGTDFAGLDSSVFDEYYDSSRSRHIGVIGIKAAAARSVAEVAADFAAARGVIR